MHTATNADVDSHNGGPHPPTLPPVQQYSSSSMVPMVGAGSTVAIVSDLAREPSPLPPPPPPIIGSPPLRRAPPRGASRTPPSKPVDESSHRRSVAPRQPHRLRSLHDLTAPIATTDVEPSNPKSMPSSKKNKEPREQHEATVKLQYPTVPKILPRQPVMQEVVPMEGLGYEVVVGSIDSPSGKRIYKPCGKHTEGRCPIYGIGFNFLDVKYYNIFATVSGNRVSIYDCLDNGSFALLQAYVDEDKDESFYTLSWARDHVDVSPLLAVGGSNGIIRIINYATKKLSKSLAGHGGPINDIRTQALQPSLIISASKDESVRLWNVHTGICILIFAGEGGHRKEVLSVDFHPSEITWFASSGMDNTVKIWSMKEFWLYVENSYSWTDIPSKFPTKCVQFPVLVAVVHNNFVDCTRWLGNFILSKGVEEEIVLWEPKPKDSPGQGSIDVLQKYPLENCRNWFVKFSCDFNFQQLAIGNAEGAIYLWEVQSCPPVLTARLHNVQCNSLIRQTAVSHDGSTILGAGEDGTIWRWDEINHPRKKHPTKEKKKQVEKSRHQPKRGATC